MTSNNWQDPEWGRARANQLRSSVEAQNLLARKRMSEDWDGLSVARGLADHRVQSLRAHFVTVSEATQIQEHQRISLLVTGGLGRNEISPYSDLALVLICDNPDSEKMRDFANACLRKSPDERVSSSDLLGHAFCAAAMQPAEVSLWIRGSIARVPAKG